MVKRVRRRRGVKLPANTRYVGRGSRWGNGWRVGERTAEGDLITREMAVQQYRELWTRGFSRRYVEYELAPLRGKDLACWCPLDQPCHADVLLELATA